MSGIVVPDFLRDGEPACTPNNAELFFTDTKNARAGAKRLCRRCPLAEACREWADNNGERWGVWGGRERNTRGGYREISVKSHVAAIERMLRAQELRDTGLNRLQIAERIGVHPSTVSAYLSGRTGHSGRKKVAA